MGGVMYGYARVSSRDQNLDRQLDALVEFGVEAGNVFADKASGKDFERPEWRQLMGVLGEGDVLVVKSIDRLLGGDGDALRPLMEQYGGALTLYVNGYVRNIDTANQAGYLTA